MGGSKAKCGMSECVKKGRGEGENSGFGEIERNGQPKGVNVGCWARESTQGEYVSNKAFKRTREHKRISKKRSGKCTHPNQNTESYILVVRIESLGWVVFRGIARNYREGS